MTVSPVRARDDVALLEGGDHADRYGLLANVEVGGAVQGPLGVELVHLLVEGPDQEHRLQTFPAVLVRLHLGFLRGYETSNSACASSRSQTSAFTKPPLKTAATPGAFSAPVAIPIVFGMSRSHFGVMPTILSESSG